MISADFDPDVKATEFVLKPRVATEKLSTHRRGWVNIDLTHPQCTNSQVLFDVLPEFTVNPQHLMVFNLQAGSICPARGVDSEQLPGGFRNRIRFIPEWPHYTARKEESREPLSITSGDQSPSQRGDNAIIADVLNVKVRGVAKPSRYRSEGSMRGDDMMLTQRRLRMKDSSRCRWVVVSLLLAGSLAGCQRPARTDNPMVEKSVADKLGEEESPGRAGGDRGDGARPELPFKSPSSILERSEQTPCN